MVRALILRAPGTNCDLETVHAFERAGADSDRLHVARLRERPDLLFDYRILAIPGGFTYGDDLGAGQVLALELRHFLAEALRAFVDRDGLVLGICNGFQVLIRAGLLPDLAGFPPGARLATLGPNESGRFESRWVRLAVASSRSPFLAGIETLDAPVAHGEGRFMTASERVRSAIGESGQIILRYIDAGGNAPAYPANPNGSEDAVAGICNRTGRILGLMPHPERNTAFYHHPRWTRRERRDGEGLAIFRNAVQAARDL